MILKIPSSLPFTHIYNQNTHTHYTPHTTHSFTINRWKIHNKNIFPHYMYPPLTNTLEWCWSILLEREFIIHTTQYVYKMHVTWMNVLLQSSLCTSRGTNTKFTQKKNIFPVSWIRIVKWKERGTRKNIYAIICEM